MGQRPYCQRLATSPTLALELALLRSGVAQSFRLRSGSRPGQLARVRAASTAGGSFGTADLGELEALRAPLLGPELGGNKAVLKAAQGARSTSCAANVRRAPLTVRVTSDTNAHTRSGAAAITTVATVLGLLVIPLLLLLLLLLLLPRRRAGAPSFP